MTTDLLETDKAIEQLLDELKDLKSSAHQLREAEKTSSQLIQSAERITELSAQLIDSSTKQTDAVRQFAANTEQRVDAVIAQHRAFAEHTENYLQSQIQPQLEKCRRTTNVNRWLIILTLFLLVANSGLALLTYQLLLNR